MNWSEQCAVVIPCRNEARTLAAVIAGARGSCRTIIVVDDGSTDATADIAQKSGAILLRHPISFGKGAALQAGFQRARETGFSWVISMDGDGQHSADDIAKFWQEADRMQPSLVIGNRMGEAHKMPWLRRMVNRLMSRWLSQHTGLSLPDSQCGFRLLQLQHLAGITLSTRRFEFESEMLVALARHQRLITFVPIEVIYADEKSKIRILPDTWRWLHWWRRLPA